MEKKLLDKNGPNTLKNAKRGLDAPKTAKTRGPDALKKTKRGLARSKRPTEILPRPKYKYLTMQFVVKAKNALGTVGVFYIWRRLVTGLAITVTTYVRRLLFNRTGELSFFP